MERKPEAEVPFEGLQRIFESCAAAMFVLEVELDGGFRIVSVNPAYLSGTGLTLEIIGKRLEDVMPEESRERLIGRNREVVDRRAVVEWEETIVFPAGKRVGHVVIAPVIDAAGHCTHIVGSVHDLTRASAAEARLQQALRLESVGRLAGGVAHDFNNLLTIILSCAELISDELQPSDPVRDGLDQIRTAAERAAGLTRQLLAFGRRQMLEPHVVDLNQLIDHQVELLRRFVGEHVELVVHTTAPFPHVFVDRTQFEQVILNLAANARDAMRHGGKLIIETACVELDEEYARCHAEVTPGMFVMLAVTDTGIGMDKATQERVFEPFFTTKEGGTGLGLASVLGIVKQSGGHIWLYSEVNRGTTFKLYFPRSDRVPESRATPLPPPGGLRGTETILLTEDEDALRIVIRRLLKHYGYQVLDAKNAVEAVLLCERFSGPIHLLVTDVVLPQTSGHELATQLSELRPALRVLYVSGYTDNTIVHQGVLEPGVHFLAKPFSAEALAAKVREVLDAPHSAGTLEKPG